MNDTNDTNDTNPERQIKRHIHAPPQKLVILSAPGLEKICQAEILSILGPTSEAKVSLDKSDAIVEGVGYREAQELAGRLHTAREVLWVLLEKRVGDIESFDKGFRGIRWNLILERRAQVHIRCNSVGSHLYHEGKIKKRGETLAKEAFLRPVDKESADHFIDLSLRSNRMRVSISMLGRPGYIRGYKESLTSNASIRQDLAAALVIQAAEFLRTQITDYKPEHIWVPFAGSGTLGFEAQIHWMGINPILFNRTFAMESFNCVAQKSIDHLRKKSMESVLQPIPVTFIESSKEQSQALTINIDSFGSQIPTSRGSFTAKEADVFETPLLPPSSAFIALNPPYGLRLPEKPGQLYRDLGALIRQIPSRSGGFVLCPTQTAAKNFIQELEGFKTKTVPIRHGGLKILVCHFAKA